MADRRERPERVGQVGPLEVPGEESGDVPSGPPEEASAEAFQGRLGAWWHGLGRSTRRTLLAAAAVVLGVLAVPALQAGQYGVPAPAPSSPLPDLAPWPSEITDVTYAGIIPEDLSGRRFVILLQIAVSGPIPVTVSQFGQFHAGMLLTPGDGLPLTITPGTSRIVHVLADVQDCGRAPGQYDLPFIDVTLTDERATQTQSEFLGGTYGDDLHRQIVRGCAGYPTSFAPAAPAPIVSPAG
ncbi:MULTISPECIES: hypothetical protein [Streptacidiphilus]|uniref:Tat pathway signal sequence domain protein n=1 Tax=Streptacidiphilus cavernicola TaxID=3342716 RepID=A0ABV6UJ39_9ACTN|nr:hypothetical protein [Streptacidiphilus jeojiense]